MTARPWSGSPIEAILAYIAGGGTLDEQLLPTAP